MSAPIVSPAGLRAAANGKREFTLKFHQAFLDTIFPDGAQVAFLGLDGVVTQFYGPNAVASAQDFIYDHNTAVANVVVSEAARYFKRFAASVQS